MPVCACGVLFMNNVTTVTHRGLFGQIILENATVIFFPTLRGSECTLRALLNLSKQAQFSEAGFSS